MLNSAVIFYIIKAIEEEHNAKGAFFSATNVKTDGTIRKWSCRLGVRKHLRGGRPAYNAEEKNFITVWDPNAKGPDDRKYRQLNISTLTDLQVCGEVVVKDGRPTSIYYKYLPIAETAIRLRTS